MKGCQRYLLLLLTLCSCASAPGSRPGSGPAPVAVPTTWVTEADTAAVNSGWWRAFDDTLASQLVQEALTNNHSVRLAATNVAAARAQADIAGAGQWPQVSATGSGTWAKRSNIGFPGAGGQVQATTSTTWSGAAAVTWELDLWGRLRANQAAALGDLQAAQADWRGAQLSLAAQTLRTYFACVEARRQVDLAQATVESYGISRQQVQSRYERGLRPTLDLLLSRTSLSTAESRLHQRRQQLDAATRQLEILVGRYPSGALESASHLPALRHSVPAGLPADLISRRPDLAAAERRLAASDARLTEARRALYPRISLTASGGRSSGALADLLDGDFSVWNLVGNISQPLFQGGRLRAGVDLVQAGADRALLSYAQSALRAFAEVESGLAAEGMLADQEEALRAASRESADARVLAEQRYAKGLTDLLTLLLAQRTAFDAESRLITVQRQRLDTRINLHLALGGTFAQDAPLLGVTGDTP
jgi:outer membrane protein, multidrug efflux system